MATLHDEISAVLDQLCACWNATRLAGIEQLWDSQEERPYAMPQEITQPIIGWDGLRNYLKVAEERLLGSSMRYWDLHAKLLAPDLAVALYQMHWNGLIKGFASPSGVDTRVTAVFRRRDADWRICHYVEAPPAFLLFLNKVYAAAVDPDFKAPDRTTPIDPAR